MAEPHPERTSSPFDYLAAAIGWLVPGAGHLFLGYRARGLVFGITVHVLFLGGLLIGGVKAMNPPEQPIWKVMQPLAGWAWVLGTNLASATDPQLHPGAVAALPSSMPQIVDVGAVYMGIAGMLNVLVIFDAVTRIARSQASGRTEGRR